MSGEQAGQRCSKCLEGCRGFLTDREKRKLCGMGVSLCFVIIIEPAFIPSSLCRSSIWLASQYWW